MGKLTKKMNLYKVLKEENKDHDTTVALWNFPLQNCNRLQKKNKTKQIVEHPLKI